MLEPTLVRRLRAVVGDRFVRTDDEALRTYGADALGRGVPPDLVVLPGSTAEVSAVAVACHEHETVMVPRGGGSGYSGGSVPVRGGVVISLERLNRILEIDEENLLAVVEPNVVTGDLQDAAEARGLCYPPDPASLRRSVIGGNVAECAGGPRAFKYGVTGHYVLGLEAVLATGEIIRTGGKVVKNVVGYDLTRLLVGSEGTLAILTQVIVRLVPLPETRVTLRAMFDSVEAAVGAVSALIRARVVPAAVELLDGESLAAVAAYLNDSALSPPGTGALLLIEVDGMAEQVNVDAERVALACRASGAGAVLRADDRAERERLWQVRRELSPALKTIAPVKFNHDVVVPRGRIPALMRLVEGLRQEFGFRIPCFGHAGDGNMHVNFMVQEDPAVLARIPAAERRLFEGVVGLEGSISGEHGIGFTKAPYLDIELSPETIALMKRVKQAFDPQGILNPGKIFPPKDSA